MLLTHVMDERAATPLPSHIDCLNTIARQKTTRCSIDGGFEHGLGTALQKDDTPTRGALNKNALGHGTRGELRRCQIDHG